MEECGQCGHFHLMLNGSSMHGRNLALQQY